MELLINLDSLVQTLQFQPILPATYITYRTMPQRCHLATELVANSMQISSYTNVGPTLSNNKTTNTEHILYDLFNFPRLTIILRMKVVVRFNRVSDSYSKDFLKGAVNRTL
jgi:hypothetical protein